MKISSRKSDPTFVAYRSQDPLGIEWELISESPYTMDRRRSTWNELDRFRHHFGRPKATRAIRNLEPLRPSSKTLENEVLEALLCFKTSWSDETTIPAIEAAIEASKYFLEFEENWDDEGSPAYAVETWQRATQFVRRTALQFKGKVGQFAPVPFITHGPLGSIDISWENGNRSILLNVPIETNSPITFYGSDGDGNTIKGTIKSTIQSDWLLAWLMS